MPRWASERARPLKSSDARRSTSEPGTSNGRRVDERVDGRLAKRRLGLVGDRLAQPLLDLGAQLGERVELARRLRQVVVDLGEHGLLDLLERHQDVRGRLVRHREHDGLRLAGGHAGKRVVELVDQPAAPHLGHVVALRPDLLALEVDDDRVAFLRRTVDRDELGHGAAELLELGVDDLLGNLGLGLRHLEIRPLAHVGLVQDGNGCGELERLALAGHLAQLDLGGAETAWMPASSAAFQNQPSRWPRTASSQTASRPMRAVTTASGAWPGRNPGIRVLAARSVAACSNACATSCSETSTARRTRFSGSSSTVVFTARPILPASRPAAASTDAGERTRTSKSFRSTGPKPVASTSSATPAFRP